MTEPFRCVLLDPPWEERGGGNRGAQVHYDLMTVDDISGLLAELVGVGQSLFDQNAKFKVADDAHMWMWVTTNYLADGLGLLRLLGFDYKRTFCWVKVKTARITDFSPVSLHSWPKPPVHYVECRPHQSHLQIGLGQYARGAHELCLFGSRGKAHVPPPANRPPDVLFAERTKHSKKPEECFSQWFEKVSPGPYLEIFARGKRDGWASFGNELDDADI